MGKIKIEDDCPSCHNNVCIRLLKLQDTNCVCPRCKSHLTVIIDEPVKIVKRVYDNNEPTISFRITHTFADNEARERIRMIDGTDPDDWLRNPRVWI